MHEVKPYSFIYAIRNALPGALCRDMIRRFEANTDQQYAGRIGQGQAEESRIKKTTDLRISGRADWKDVDQALMQSLARHFNEIGQAFPFFVANSFK
ncbi:MAG TPA: hypothetical protein VIR61_07855, partial [Sulfuricaulis sp.]